MTKLGWVDISSQSRGEGLSAPFATRTKHRPKSFFFFFGLQKAVQTHHVSGAQTETEAARQIRGLPIQRGQTLHEFGKALGNFHVVQRESLLIADMKDMNGLRPLQVLKLHRKLLSHALMPSGTGSSLLPMSTGLSSKGQEVTNDAQILNADCLASDSSCFLRNS